MKSLFTYILLFCLTLGCSIHTSAETVSQKEASRIAEKFFNAASGQVMAKPKLVYNGKRLTTDRLFSPFYIYNHPAGGAVIISAENKAMPILGYSLKSNFDPSDIDTELLQLLQEYATDIEYIRYDSRIPDEAIAAWSDIASTIDHTLNNYTRDENLKRLENEERSAVWILRDRATEFPGIAEQRNKSPLEEEIEIEEEPFLFYENFLAETKAEAKQRLDAFDSKINITEPKIYWLGGGHFQVRLPSDVQMARIYNMEGRLVRELTYRNTDTAIFNLDSEPRGFYFALLNDIEGKPYGFKLYK